MASAKRPASGARERFCVEALEPRLLYSADLGPSLLASALVSPVAEHRLLEAEAPPADAAAAAQ
ncbi:MAG: LEPR-XLL domain-containing protein, partial [Betaproteobacteria bacterium]|nr:LEPR-XLL domain-containing protein [Betaproteobacteria bacterium]